jgi:hypothetical protein
MALTGAVHRQKTFANTRSLTAARKLDTATMLADGKGLVTSQTDGPHKV